MLLVENLLALRGDRIVFENIGFALAAGEALLLRGPNGAGKSTLLRILAGLRRPGAGVILWQQGDVFQDRDDHAKRIGWLSHHDAIKPGLTALENLAFALRIQGGNATAALDRMGLAELRDLPARMLSAGQQRRLALARLMLGHRPLWLLDEPTNGLDIASIARLEQALAAHRAQGGIAIVASHVELALPDARRLELGT